MGNQHSQDESTRSNSPKFKAKENVRETTHPIHPLEKLAKALSEKCAEEEHGNGINCRIFTKYVFPKYPRLAEILYYNFLLGAGHEGSKKYLSTTVFHNQAQKLLTVMSDERQVELYLKMFSGSNEVSREAFHELLSTAYILAMDHYPEGGPQNCPLSERTLTAVLDSAFHRKQQLSVTFLANWIMQHSPRLLLGLHRFVIHCLSTAHRTIAEPRKLDEGVDLSTPVLERNLTFPDLAAYAKGSSSGGSASMKSFNSVDQRNTNENGTSVSSDDDDKNNDMLPVSQVWILACTLPLVYTRPSPLHSPSSAIGLSSLDSQGLISRMLGMICPSHWVLLYNSRDQGLGANRFTHHVLNYRGPSLTFLQGEGGVQFCVAATDEWRESNHYWGHDDCMVIQILPLFHVVERGPKLLYLNTSIRGYPHGVRAGKDPRKPSIDINEGFTIINYCGIPYPLVGIEVWGCGTTHSREAQLDMQKWQVKQAEKQRQVKMTSSDWVDHPDRYLLELAGRQSYNK